MDTETINYTKILDEGGHTVEKDKSRCRMELFKPVEFSSESLTLNVDVEDYFYIKQWQQRMCMIDGDIDYLNIGSLLQSIIQINMEDKNLPIEERIPIKIFLSSDGGDVFDGFALIDAIQTSATPIYTINMSHWYSMASVIGMCGHKRFATKNASFLIHDGTTIIGDSSNKVHDFMKFDAQIQDRLKKIILDKTNITVKTYNKKSREEWYFFADEAKKLGVIDGIIGEDISIEQII